MRKEIHAEFYSRSINSRALNGQEPPENSTGREDRYQGENSKSSDTMRTLARSLALPAQPRRSEGRIKVLTQARAGQRDLCRHSLPTRGAVLLKASLQCCSPHTPLEHERNTVNNTQHSFNQNTCQIQQVLKKSTSPN